MTASKLQSLPTLEDEFYEYSTVYREVEELQRDRDNAVSRHFDLSLKAQDILNTLTAWYGEDGILLFASTFEFGDEETLEQIEVIDSDKVVDWWDELEEILESIEEIYDDVRKLDLEYAKLRKRIDESDRG